MITGMVRENEAWIKLQLRGPTGRQSTISAVIDTGYTGTLTVPRALIIALSLPWQGFSRGRLADGNESLFSLFEATVVWDRRARLVYVAASDTDPLVGMDLLNGYELKMQVRQGGRVTIRRLPKK